MKNISQKLKSIFDEVLNLTSVDRKKYLAELQKTEPDLVSEVKTLLKALDATEDFLETPSIVAQALQDEENESNSFIGERIGPYTIIEEAGSGGMGIVYIGQRDDDEFEHKVAIKILRHGLTTDYLIKRFQKERQTLANLQHPNIAKLFDGGTTKVELPFLVMEYIDGIPITEYCDEQKLNIKQRLKLFQSVCDAIQYAHQNLVVHRDIKPGNILVNKEGRPKLLDFGVAKLLDEENSDLTKTRMWHLTPEYASPEQIKGETISTASDVYSLGVLLYQILSGYQPYQITSGSPFAISKIVTDVKTIKPSEIHLNTELITDEQTKERNKKTSHQLKGDLDNIILKAMHKDPAQRFLSAQQFSEDITKYLTGLPVIARKDSTGYRLSKFIKRHKVGFVSSVLGILFLIGSVIAISWQANIATKERDNAKVELTKFEEINNFLLEMLASADPEVEGKDVKVYDLLEKATDDLDVKFKNFPKIKSAIKQTLGSTFIGLGEYEKAKRLLIESLESNKVLFGQESKEVAQSLHQLGLCYDWIGNLNLADSFYNEGISLYQKISKKPIKDLADVYNDYGTLLTNTGKYDSSTTLLKKALDIYKIYNKEKGQKEAITINNLATNLHHQYKVDDAEKYYLESIQILKKLYGEDRSTIASIYNNLGFIYIDNKDYESAENALQKAYKIKLVTLGEDHPYVGLALINLGMLNFIRKEYQAAESQLLKAIDLYKRTKATKHSFSALSYYWLGRVYLESNQLKKSERAFGKCISVREEMYSKDHFKVWSVKGELGVCLLKQKKYFEVEKLLMGSLEFYKKNRKFDTKKIIRYTKHLAIFFEETRNISKAKYYQLELEKLTKETSSKK
ncbi:MAG: serine/threonine-protein kinase [Melioribacteraceae bacterium]